MLQHTMDELEVRVSADNIPERIDVDVSQMVIGDSVHVRDLPIPEGVEVLESPDRSVCSLIPPQAGIVDAAAATTEVATPSEPEVIRRKKEDDEK